MGSKQGNSMVVKVKKFAPLIFLFLIIGAFFGLGFDEYLSFRALSDNRAQLSVFIESYYVLSLVLYLVIYTIATSVSFPGASFLTILGGFLFGWLVGGLITVISATIGATVIFLIAATSFGSLFRQKAGPWLTRLEGGFRENEMNYLLFLRLVPAFPFWLINIAPALLGVSLRTYVIATFIGIIPGTFAFSFFGTGLESVIVEQQEQFDACQVSGGSDCVMSFSASSVLTPELVLSLLALAVIALIPILVKRLRGSLS